MGSQMSILFVTIHLRFQDMNVFCLACIECKKNAASHSGMLLLGCCKVHFNLRHLNILILLLFDLNVAEKVNFIFHLLNLLIYFISFLCVCAQILTWHLL